jgi:hypothetical protein
MPKKLQYEEQIKAPHLFRLLSLEMLHKRVEIEKRDYRKYLMEFSQRQEILAMPT